MSPGTHPTGLSRRSFLGGAIGGAAVIALGSPALARALELPGGAGATDLTYAALVEAVAPVAPDAAQSSHALAAFRAWQAGLTPGARADVERVFGALDAGAGGSFRSASLSARKRQLDSWLQPDGDPLQQPELQNRLMTAVAARRIAAAPSAPEYGSTIYDLPLGPR